MNYFFEPGILSGTNHLSAEESSHCIRVLRKKTGDSIQILDGMGGLYHCRITEVDPYGTVFEVIAKTEQQARDFGIHIAISPVKNMDRLEWFIEKSVEIGIDKISFVRCQNSERNILKTDRLLKKAVSALKQSGNLFLPDMHEMIGFNEFILTFEKEGKRTGKYIAHAEAGTGNFLMKVADRRTENVVLIGPEGDFSLQELNMASEAGFFPVSLGNSRLRTETAGLVACMILNLINT